MDAPLTTHISDLRTVAVRIFFVIVLGVITSFLFHERIIIWLTQPHTSSQNPPLEFFKIDNQKALDGQFLLPPEGTYHPNLSLGVEKMREREYKITSEGHLIYSLRARSLVFLSPLEGICIALKTSLWVGIVLTSPVWLFFAYQFIMPALTNSEKTLIFPFFLFSTFFLLLGFLFTFNFTIPITNEYLQAFNARLGDNFWSLSSYLDYTFFLVLANGIAFELSVILLFAIHLNVLDSSFLKNHRKKAYVIAFILGALLTPPDVLTQFLLAIPLIGLYELSILYGSLKRKARKVK